MLGNLRWTDKQREIAQLVADGKEFKDITAFGYSNYMVTKVKNALEEGQKPKAKVKVKVKVRTRTENRELTRVDTKWKHESKPRRHNLAFCC